MRTPVLVVSVPSIVAVLGLAIWLDGDFWWWAAGLWTGGMLVTAMWARDEPPEHIAKWGRGAEGERRTGKVLEGLSAQGWRIEHDRQMGKYNLDHIAIGPTDVFLIETKTSTGVTSMEAGALTVRFPDDEEEVFVNHRLHSRMRERAASFSRELRSQGAGRRWVHAVVVIWGSFPQGLVHHDDVTYVHGSRLQDVLVDPRAAASRGAS
jgi:hypothetical protein